MPLPEEGTCEPWCEWADIVACVSDAALVAELNAMDSGLQDDLIAQVSEVLYLLDGKRMPGTCTATRSVCLRCSCHRNPCCCAPGERVDLGSKWPVARVTNVTIDGATLDTAAYRVDDWRWLVRLDGEAWPRCADLTDEDAFSVTWEYGREITPGARRACALFVLELAKKCLGKKCELPERVTSVTRENVTYTIIDSMRMLDDGRTGFYFVDLWLAARKRGRKRAPGMSNPDACGSLPAIGTDSGSS